MIPVPIQWALEALVTGWLAVVAPTPVDEPVVQHEPAQGVWCEGDGYAGSTTEETCPGVVVGPAPEVPDEFVPPAEEGVWCEGATFAGSMTLASCEAWGGVVS